VTKFAPEAVAVMMAYSWPGNIRELRNEIYRAVALTEAREVSAHAFSSKVLQGRPGTASLNGARAPGYAGMPQSGTLQERLDAIESVILKETLLRHRWNKTHASKELGLSRVGLRSKLVRFGLEEK
jgi:two-component system, NtrC family, response regulator HupR/HoxA